jgi:quercetin dioxygenase-like cupin family protein
MRNISFMAALSFVAAARAGDSVPQEIRLPEGNASVEIPFNEMQFQHSGYVWYGRLKSGDHTPDIEVSDAYGKIGTGAHGTLLKWPTGFKSVLHTHTADYYAVVIQGTVLNYRPGGKKTPLTPGSYWFQRGGEPHVTECVTKGGCMAFMYQPVKFDAQFGDEMPRR